MPSTCRVSIVSNLPEGKKDFGGTITDYPSQPKGLELGDPKRKSCFLNGAPLVTSSPTRKTMF